MTLSLYTVHDGTCSRCSKIYIAFLLADVLENHVGSSFCQVRPFFRGQGLHVCLVGRDGATMLSLFTGARLRLSCGRPFLALQASGNSFTTKSVDKNVCVIDSAAPQAPNRQATWSRKQMPRHDAMDGARFETINLERQPKPLAAIKLIEQAPVREVAERVVSCDGGGGPLGHPKIYINLVPAYTNSQSVSSSS